MRYLSFLVLLGLAGCLLSCSYPANPNTKVSFDPLTHSFYIGDSKDNDLEVTNFRYKDQAREVVFDKLAFTNNASKVREANVKQIEAYTEQVKAMSAVLSDLMGMLRAAVPLLGGGARTTTLETPYGSLSSSTTPPPITTTQPAP